MKDYDAILMIASSESDANIYYASGFVAPDPFIFIQLDNKKIMVMSDLEIERAKVQSQADDVLSASLYEEKAKKRGIKNPSLIDEVHEVLLERNIKDILVPENFPVGYADSLRKKGYKIESKKEPFFEERAVKTEEEIGFISNAMRCVEEAFGMVVEEIKKAKIRDSILYKGEEPITSESIKRLINVELIKNEHVAEHTIVACGDDACNPHFEGSGILRANEAIIVDIFPRSILTGYFGDFTRTIVKGKPSKDLEKQYDAVQRAQERAFGLIKDGAYADEVHSSVQEVFLKAGYKTGNIDGKIQGFIHGTGHGVGLDIHELPRIGKKREKLKEGNVVTVEPGLYYFGIGGVRIEDTVVVRRDGYQNLASFPKEFVV